MSFTLPTTGSTTPTSTGGLKIPAAIAGALGIKPGTELTYSPPATTSNPNPVAMRPSTGVELYDAIGQAFASNSINQSQYDELIAKFFTPGFNPATTPNATSYLTDATDTLESSGYDLAQYSQTYKAPPVQPRITSNGSGISTVGLSSATAAQVQSSYGVVSQYLENWGLAGVDAKKVLAIITNYGDQVVNTDEILEMVRGNIAPPPTVGGSSTKDWQIEFKQAYEKSFPGLAQYNAEASKKGSLNVRMTEAQYQTYVAAVQDKASQYGAPQLNSTQLSELLNSHVSAAEYGQRVQDIYSAYANADPNVLSILQKNYGINQSNIMHYLTTGVVPDNPKGGNVGLPEMQRQIASADIQDYATRVGLNGVNQTGYNQLADMAKLAGTAGNQGLGYGVSQIESSLQTAARDTALTRSLPGVNQPTVDTKTLIASQLAGFGGISQVAAETQVARAEQAKAAPFEKGGGYVESAKGVTGLGSART